MIKSPVHLLRTTEGHGDVIGEALRALRIRGTLLLREIHRTPFRVVVPSGAELAAFLRIPGDARAVAFHLAERGSFELDREGNEPLMIESGEMVLVLGGRAHALQRGRAAREIGFAELLEVASEGLFGSLPIEADTVQIVCGALVFENAPLNPLFESLPEFLPIRANGGDDSRTAQLLSIMLEELVRQDPSAVDVVERLLELICAREIRAYASEGGRHVGWFRGVADNGVGRAIRAFHREPGGRWSVSRLASEAHLSASRFAARFADVTGVTAMAYVTRWRMNLAMRALSETDKTVSELAFEVGYESPAAFSRAFKRVAGVPPAEYRRRFGIQSGDGHPKNRSVAGSTGRVTS